ncbi:MAG: DUF5615 family PIN-like protein [Salinibacter sp.]|uniref:DUF5615 family PIN-like protein n=1 Tax=Salinibacter sp. TaxID=2065818 RepID=UPI002FC304D0
MASIRYYLDEHIAEAVAKGLRRRGVDVRTLAEAGMLGASDEEHFAFAREEERTIVTQDDDFLRLAAQSAEHPGVVYLPQRRSVGETVRGLTLIAEVLGREGMRGHVEFL